jgi:hypothetical protein
LVKWEAIVHFYQRKKEVRQKIEEKKDRETLSGETSRRRST